MNRIILNLFVILLTITIAISSIWAKNKTNLPTSREAQRISESPDGRIIIRATGIHKKVPEAKIDAEKSAIYWVITERLLFTREDENNFEKIQEQFFKTEKKKTSKYAEFIEWRSDIIIRKKIDGKYRITMDFKINERRLEKYLVKKGTIKYPWIVIVEILGEPSFFVIPNVGPEDDLPRIVQLMEQDDNLKITASKIKNYFTDRRINVFLPENVIKNNRATKIIKDIEAQRAIERGSMSKDFKRSDIKNLLALVIGADIYFTYEVRLDENTTLDTYQANVQFEAYETATGKLLSSETGTSKERPTSVSKEALIEEAVSDGLRLALKKIIGYWIDYIKKGVPYLVTFHNATEFDEYQIEEIQDIIPTNLTELFAFMKPIIIEETQMEFIVRAKPEKYKKNFIVRTAIKNKFKESCNIAKLSNFGALVSKWIQLEIKEVK